MTISKTMLQDPKVLWTDALLRFADVDYYGHVSNRAFSEILEGGRIAFIASHIEPKITADLFVVIARLTIDFWNEFSFPGGARTGTWLSKIGRTSATFDQAILGDNGLVGAATGVCVLVEKVSRRPTPFSDELRQSLQSLCAPHYANKISVLAGQNGAERKKKIMVS